MSRRATWILLLGALGLAIVGTPTTDAAYERDLSDLESAIAARTFHISAPEMLDLMHNNRVSLAILDVRDEADFNLFHLRDARRMTPLPREAGDLVALPPLTVAVVVSNDEARANETWMRLRALGVDHLYILAGGINGWLDTYRAGHALPGGGADETLRHRFDAALGARVPAAVPPAPPAPKEGEPLLFEPKVKMPKPIPSAGGGCG